MLNPAIDSARRQINPPCPDACLFTLGLWLRHAVEASLVGLKPKAAFLSLFNLDGPLRAGEVVLATSLTAGTLDSTLARHQLTFYHRPLTEANSVAWLVKAP